jgi:hypothetical protein
MFAYNINRETAAEVRKIKALMQPVDMISWFTRDGVPTPIKYRLSGEDAARLTVRVDRIMERKEEKRAGNRMLVFKCRSMIDGTEKIYEIKYEVNTCRWYLYKI